MRNFPEQTPETAFLDDFADYMSNGNYSIVKRVFYLLINANCMLLMVFLNKNMGLKVAKNSESVIAIIYLVVLSIISMFHYENDLSAGMTREVYSFTLIWYHGWAYVFFSIWRKVGAWWNLRNASRPGYRNRLEHGIGDSVIYPVFRFILTPLGLIDREKNPATMWKMNEDRFMQIWQPLLLVGVGFLAIGYGYELYGGFLIFATVCFTALTIMAFNNTARLRQSKGNAEQINRMIEVETHEQPNHVIGD